MTDQTPGYCPACGRGDVAPTADQYEQQRLRAEQAEAGRIAADNMLRAVCAVFGGPHQDPIVKARETLRRAERAEAALARVHHLAAAIHAGAPWLATHTETAARIRAAITGPGPAAPRSPR